VTKPIHTGDRASLDHLFDATYEELRRLARSVRNSDPSASISPTTLVNEAWLKLARSPAFTAMSPLHGRRVAARALRQGRVEAARRRNGRKRGGREAPVTLDDELDVATSSAGDLLQIDAALNTLASLSERQAAMVEARFFGGFDVAETAELLGISEATVLRDWRAARAWLAEELRP